ncbi:MAG: ester cyclase [Vicinamibacterales bacterium]
MRDLSDLLATRPRRQRLNGFDPEYSDIVDYIVRCTHRIWEEKNVGLIRTHYTADCVIHTLAGEVRGADAVIANTVKTLAAFPDRTLLADNVIWSGDDEAGFYTSHRITSHLTNTGASEFGPPTGRRATIAVIADCAVRENRIFEEWLVRDNLALVLQLGMDPHAIAARGAAVDRAAPLETRRWREAEMARVRNQPSGVLPSAEPMRSAAETWHTLWNERAFSLVRDLYAPTCTVQAPAARVLFGHGEVIGFVIHMLGAIPDARVSVDHVAAIPYGEAGHDVAIRWTLVGTHDGPGLHRPATGLPVLILGVTHQRITAGRITEEWIVFDELALLRQLYWGDQ